jgi:tetratricopeptide (TPR) repeat protein
MNHLEQAQPQDMEQLLQDAVRHILEYRNFDGFLRWMRTAMPTAVSEEGLSSDDQHRLATLLGLAIWNVTPRPDNDFRPLTTATPEPDAPCPCGSAETYGNCCGQQQVGPELPAELIWDLMLEDLTDADLQRALQLQAVPQALFARIADHWLAIDRPGRAVALLEPLFDTDLSRLDAHSEPALDALCDAYDALDHWKKKQSFLLRVADQGSRELKAAAWQRLSVQFIDEGEFDYAFDAFLQAQRNSPDGPATALLEITLLAAQYRDEHARARALFWHHKLRRQGEVEDNILQFLERARVDPQEALVSSQASVMDPMLVRLRAWIKASVERDPVAIGVVLFDDPLEDADGRQLPLFDTTELPVLPTIGNSGRFAALCSLPQLRQLEHTWRRLFPVGKPYSTGLTAADGERAWQQDAWLRFLEIHPEAADSPDILDDIATALYAHPESSLPWVSRVLLQPVLERAEALLLTTLNSYEAERLPWSDERNRPMLRMQFRLYLLRAESGERCAATQVLERLLALNPRDHHGVRAALMNHYLRDGENNKALELAQQFPTDVLADLAYGEVLALYRLGQQESAAHALHEAVGRLPRIPRFLLRKRIKRPTLAANGFTPGGEEQAWLYREAMRDVWEAEPGLLAWMKKVTA